MITPNMIVEEYRDASIVSSADFCDRFVLDQFLGAYVWRDKKSVKNAIRLYQSAANALYAQAIIQATGALEEF